MPGSRAPQEARRQQILSAAYAVALDDGIGGVTLRTVAARAGLSHGLVVFHFKEKDQLIAAILDRVLDENDLREGSVAVARSPSDGVASHLRAEMHGLTRDPRWLRLFLEYWALGVRDRRIRAKIGPALARYRETFRHHVIASGEEAGVSTPVDADAFAAVAVSLVSGFALQATIARAHVDPDAYARVVDIVMTCVTDGTSGSPATTSSLVRRTSAKR